MGEGYVRHSGVHFYGHIVSVGMSGEEEQFAEID